MPNITDITEGNGNLVEGQTYTASAIVTNRSAKSVGGVSTPVAAVLTITALIKVGSAILIGTPPAHPASQNYNFTAGETHQFDFTFQAPMINGNASAAGTCWGWVLDPTGNILTGPITLNFTVIPAITDYEASLQWG